MGRLTVTPVIKEEPVEQMQIKQEPDTVEVLKHVPTPSASPERLAGEARGESKIENDGIRCLHCGNIIDGRAHYGFCTNCAYCVKKRCPICRQMVGDIDRHMKRHSEPSSLRCTVKGCDSTKAFTEQGLSQHMQRAHPALFSRERSKKRRRQQSSAEYYAQHGHRSLSEASPAVVEYELDKMTRTMGYLRRTDEV